MLRLSKKKLKSHHNERQKVNDQNMDINQKKLECDRDIISVQIRKKRQP